MRVVKYLSAFLLSVTILGALGIFAGLYGTWLSPVVDRGDTDGFVRYLDELLESQDSANAALVLIENGNVRYQFFAQAKQATDAQTLFPVASMSKFVTAIGVLTLAEQGKVELDKPVQKYLKRWQLPVSQFNIDQVTISNLLSHTAGLTDDLGFADLALTDTVPRIVDSLNSPLGSAGYKAIEVGIAPNTEWRYSGGGYLVLQLLIEDVTGESFTSWMANNVFAPTNMRRATYEPLAGLNNVSLNYGENGEPDEFFQYAAAGATGLAASTSDLVALVQYLQDPKQHTMVRQLTKPMGQSLGATIWGQGAMLYAPTDKGAFVFGHDGANEPAINSALRMNPDNNDALIVLTNGGDRLASRLGYEWTLWQTGYPDFLAFDKAITSAFKPIVLGAILLLLVFVWRFFARQNR